MKGAPTVPAIPCFTYERAVNWHVHYVEAPIDHSRPHAQASLCGYVPSGGWAGVDSTPTWARGVVCKRCTRLGGSNGA